VPVSKETNSCTAKPTLLCDRCSVLEYEQMRLQDGQVHHENWTKLTESASRGCTLCTFFTLAPLHPKTSSRSVFYSDSTGPLYLKILPTFKGEEACLHVCVPQDKRTAAIYYLYLSTTGNEIRSNARPKSETCADNSENTHDSEIEMVDSEHDRLSPTAVGKISAWLQTCRIEHRSCRWQTGSKLPTRVIDISPIDMPGCVRLIEGRSELDTNYVALSHCWGNMPFNRFDL
jgi:hypothetical protein